MDASLVVSIVSLLIAVISLAMSYKAQKLQNRVNEIDLILKQDELAEKKKEAVIEARIVNHGKGKHVVKIWNSGNSTAKNITATWNEKDGILLFSKEKMPFDFLDPQKGFELAISTFYGSPEKLLITTEWEDEEGKKCSKEQWCDL